MKGYSTLARWGASPLDIVLLSYTGHSFGEDIEEKILKKQSVYSWDPFLLLSFTCKGNLRGVKAKMLDCDLEVNDFELQSCSCIHFLTNTLGKGVNPSTSVLNSITAVFQQEWRWQQITHEVLLYLPFPGEVDLCLVRFRPRPATDWSCFGRIFTMEGWVIYQSKLRKQLRMIATLVLAFLSSLINIIPHKAFISYVGCYFPWHD